MAALFDKYFMTFPMFDRCDDFFTFWDKSISELKKIPVEPLHVKSKDNRQSGFESFDIRFRSIRKNEIEGKLYTPQSSSKTVIIFHDYNETEYYNSFKLDPEFSYLFITLRNHQHIEKKAVIQNAQKKETVSPNFFAENIHDKTSYYAGYIYLDALRSVEFIRLFRALSSSDIFIIGRGAGAACAVFTAAYSSRVKAISMDSPALCYLSFSQNHSKNELTSEINKGFAGQKNKNEIKKNLTFFDCLNFADKINIPVQMSLGLKDVTNHPQSAFALFNRFLTDKTAEIYPDSGYESGGEKQWVKSLDFFKTIQ